MAKQNPTAEKTKEPKQKGNLKRYFGFVKGYWILTLMTPVMIFIDVIIGLQLVKIMGDLVDYVYLADTPEFSRHTLHMKLLEMLGFCLLTLVVGYISSRCSSISTMGFGANMRAALFNKIQDLSFENIDKFKVGSLITRMISDTSRIQSLFSNIIVIFIKGPFTLIMALQYALNISRSMSRVFYAAIPAIVLILVVLGKKAVPLFKIMLQRTDDFNGTLRGNINGIRVVKSFVREEYEKTRFEKIIDLVADSNIRAQTLVIYISPFIMLVIYGCTIFSMLYGSNVIISNKFAGVTDGLTIGELTAFTSYISQVLSALMVILMVFVSMIVARASITRVNEVFNEEPAINDNDGDPALTVKNGSVEFRNVSFKYSEEAEKNILENINLTVQEGEMLGIIGATGSAKSTLINLIPRLYDATEGEVLVGGENVKHYKFKNLREGVSVVLQQTMLFSGTIAENIRWGKMDATDEEVIEAAKAAQAHDFIMEKENGYDTELGHGGNTVSGGQRQRLCMARAFIKKPKVLILDDSTSAVDTATDAKVRAELRTEAFKNITKIIIAQRITSIMDADRIIILDDGKICGMGTHDELVKNNEIYQEIFMSQQEGVLAQ